MNPQLPTPSDDEILYYFYSDEGIFDFEKAKKFSLKFLGLDIVSEINSGNNGVAYLIDDGTKLKFTSNENEFKFAKRNIGVESEFRANYYKAQEIVPDCYYILMEFLNPINREERDAIRNALYDTPNSNQMLVTRLLQIRNDMGPEANDLRNPENYGLKNGKVATFDPVSEVIDETQEILTKGGVILIKGRPLDDSTQRLYATTVKTLLNLNRNKKDNQVGKPAQMAMLNNNLYRISIKDGRLRVNGVDWPSTSAQLNALGIPNRNLTLNNNKTPLHWESLKYSDIATCLNKISSQVLNLPNIRWQG
jgi:hypothetical protein